MPQIPTAHDLFSYALLDAQVAHALRSLPIPEDAGPSPTVTTTTATAATATTTKPAAPTASTPLMVNGYYVESTRGPIRNHVEAMEALRQFRINIRSHLPQLGGPTMQGFWGLREGKVVLASLNVALASVPCAKVHIASDEARTVTYPQGLGAAGRLQKIMIDGQEVMFARGANTNRALYSTNGLDWYDTHVYTDDAVEAQKVALWSGIMESSKAAAEKYRKAARWMPW
jgi:hypothetical protein